MITCYVDFNKNKYLIRKMTTLTGAKFNDRNVYTDFSLNLNECILDHFNTLAIIFEVSNQAVKRKDWVMIVCMLLDMRVSAIRLSNFFSDTDDDLKPFLAIKKTSYYAYNAKAYVNKDKEGDPLPENCLIAPIDLNEFKSILHAIVEFEQQDRDIKFCKLNQHADLNEFISENVNVLGIHLEAAKKAVQQNEEEDLYYHLNAICTLSTQLSNFFLAMLEDIESVVWADNSSLPDIPVGYEYPDFYNMPDWMRNVRNVL